MFLQHGIICFYLWMMKLFPGIWRQMFEKFRVCLDLEKLEGKEKNLESNFLSTVWFEKSYKKKKEEIQGNFELLWRKVFLSNMREK